MLPDLATVQHHPALEEIVDILCNKTQEQDRGFFRTEVAYFLGKMASTMRATIVTKDRGELPVNIYAIALATSGFGKGFSVGIIENEIMQGFKSRFMEDAFPVLAENNLWVIANNRAARNGSDPQEEFDKAMKEFRSYGAYPFTFDSGTTPAVKQLRQKLLMSNIGAINLQIDEIGSNLVKETEVLTTFLELYDQGRVKQKLVKNTSDNQRGEDLDGKTPANMLLFGTPAKLFDGGQTENEFYSMLETGYARRCLFGYGVKRLATTTLTAEEIFEKLINPAHSASMAKWTDAFYKLADPALFNWKMEMSDDVSIELIEYKIDCERRAALMAEHDDVRKSEISHRYFKALKLAGAYAFVEQSTQIELEHIHCAIKLVEESGEAFNSILTREETYVKLAKFIAQEGTEQTHADLHGKLKFYPKGNGPRTDMMLLATAWGYKNHMIIKKSFRDGIEFFKGETLQETDINKLTLSYSAHFAYDYHCVKAPFDQLHQLTQLDGHHFANHHFTGNHRSEETTIAGFDMVVLDIDEGITLQAAHELMADYKFLTYTTKRHQTLDADGNQLGDRFRMILPINYRLTLDNDEYKEFMRSIFAWLPFKTDESYAKREKKSETFHGGTFHYNMEGDLFDALPFIPKTSRYEQHQKQTQALGSLDNLQRWFAGRIANGNRNNQMIKYALCLVDFGWDLPNIKNQVKAFNAMLAEPMTAQELDSTILVTAAKRYQELNQQAA